MTKRGVYWTNKVREHLIDFRGRTCIVDNVDDWDGMARVKFDGSRVSYLVALKDIYFQDHLDGYNQPNLIN